MTVVVIQPDATAGIDTYINGGSTGSNYGAATELRTAGPASIKKILIKFDLSSIPAGVTINSASLALTCFTNGADQNVTLHRGLLSFNEGNGNASLGSIAGSTWAQRDDFGNVNWTGGAGGAAGTEYASSPAATTFVDAVGVETWDVTAEVQAIVNGSITNHGWWLLQANGVDNVFRSSDYATAADRPKLTVDYVNENMAATVAGTCTVTGTLSAENVIQLQPDESTAIDTQVRSPFPTFNYGIWNTIGASTLTKGMIKFDLPTLPPGARLTRAVLYLTCVSGDTTANVSINIHRSLVEWFEGPSNGAAPPGGVDASTWSLRNVNGSVRWGDGATDTEPIVGIDFATTPTATTTVGAYNLPYEWDVTADVEDWYDGDTNYGWWTIGNGVVSNAKTFATSNHATTSARPVLLLFYTLEALEGSSDGSSSVSGTLTATGNMRGTAEGTSDHEARLTSNEFTIGQSFNTSTASGTLRATGNMRGNAFGDSTAAGDMIANQPISGTAAGTSSHVAHLMGIFRMQGSAAGQGIAIARISSEGQMRASAAGTSTASAVGYARAVSVAAVIGCNPVPLLHITDGTIKPNGQLNILNFLGDRAGYFLVNYRPQVFQYKDGGYWSSSPQSQGRRLRGKVFDNVVDLIEVHARAGSQDALIEYQQDLMAFQEAASDYWSSDYSFVPYYLVAKAARETNARYALIHMISCPELNNPYTQPFFDDAVGATFTNLTIRIEHGMWMSTPPGRFDCVEISGEREWTVSGWQAGS